MDPARDLAAAEVIEALPHIAYLVDLRGRIVAVNSRPWAEFARDNGAEGIAAAESVIGRPLIDFIDGVESRQAARAVFDVVVTGRLPRVTYAFRCDAADVEREMELVVSPIRSGGRIAALLYQSIMVQQRGRRVVDLLTPLAPAPLFEDLPILRICSYCKRVFESSTSEWLPTEEYGVRGGTTLVRLSHSICATCLQDTVEPVLRALEDSGAEAG